jgi:hypothetical protein
MSVAQATVIQKTSHPPLKPKYLSLGEGIMVYGLQMRLRSTGCMLEADQGTLVFARPEETVLIPTSVVPTIPRDSGGAFDMSICNVHTLSSFCLNGLAQDKVSFNPCR